MARRPKLEAPVSWPPATAYNIHPTRANWLLEPEAVRVIYQTIRSAPPDEQRAVVEYVLELAHARYKQSLQEQCTAAKRRGLRVVATGAQRQG